MGVVLRSGRSIDRGILFVETLLLEGTRACRMFALLSVPRGVSPTINCWFVVGLAALQEVLRSRSGGGQ